jgi:hypothetical protein
VQFTEDRSRNRVTNCTQGRAALKMGTARSSPPFSACWMRALGYVFVYFLCLLPVSTSCVYFLCLLPVIVSFEEFISPAFTSAFPSPALAGYLLLAELTATPELRSLFPAVPGSISPWREEPIWFVFTAYVVAGNAATPRRIRCIGL